MKKEIQGDEVRFIAEEDLSSQTASQARKFLNSEMNSLQARSVTLDLTNTTHIDSLGVALVVGLGKSCQSQGLAFQVEVSDTDAARVLHTCRLEQIFSIKEVSCNG